MAATVHSRVLYSAGGDDDDYGDKKTAAGGRSTAVNNKVQPSPRDWRGKNETIEAKVGQSGVGLHSFSAEERKYLCNYVNSVLKHDDYLAESLPLDPSSNKIFEVVSDGIFLWYSCRQPLASRAALQHMYVVSD